MYIKITPDSWRWVMLAGAAPAVLTFFIRLFVPESERWQAQVRRTGRPSRSGRSSPARSGGSTLLGHRVRVVALIGTWGLGPVDPAVGRPQLKPGDPTGQGDGPVPVVGRRDRRSLLAPLVGNVLGRRWTYFLLCATSLAAVRGAVPRFAEYTPRSWSSSRWSG
jgi:hypothetical protein